MEYTLFDFPADEYTIMTFCEACDREAWVPAERLPGELRFSVRNADIGVPTSASCSRWVAGITTDDKPGRSRVYGLLRCAAGYRKEIGTISLPKSNLAFIPEGDYESTSRTPPPQT